jgi:TonB-linked SusC/RagA family outer membrane protein
MRKKLLLHIVVWLGLMGQALAQDRTVSGRVTAEDGSALPGVNVSVRGTTRGVTTDAQGAYRISAPANATLIFSSIGFIRQEIAVGTRSTLDVQLAADSQELSEVVVVGYGTQSKKTTTGAITSIGGEKIAALPVQSFDQSLAGRAPGVNVTIPNGVLNNAPVIRIRGVSSISQSSSPLIVVDGLPINSGDVSSGGFTVNNPLGDINPNDIESVEVLKDASATAIYGSRASAGVLLITTKKGKEGKARISYDGWIGQTQAFRFFDLLNAQQYMDIKNEAARNFYRDPNNALYNPFNPTLDANGNVVDTDWYDYVYQNGLSHSHNLSINGGTRETKYAFSLGYTDQQGMIKKNTFSRLSGRMNIEHQLNKAIKVGANITLANSFNRSPNTGTTGAFSTGGLGRLPLVLQPNVAPYNPDGTYNINRAANNLGLGNNLLSPGGYYNPLPDLDLSKFTSENDHLLGNVFADVRLLEGMTFRTSYGIDNTKIEDIDFRNGIHGEAGSLGGQANNIFTNVKVWNWQNYLTYNFTLAQNNNFSVVVGTEAQKFTINRWGASRQGLADPFFSSYQGNFTTNNPPVGNFQTQSGFVSYFGRVNYDFNQKYLFSFTLRRDGYSAYSANNKYGNFPGGSVGWRVSEEGFWKNSSLGRTLNEFKLRASYGITGNSAVNNNFASLSLFGSGLYGTVPTWVFVQAGNPNLQWETSTKLDLGINFGLFSDRITGEVTYFENLVDNLVLDEPQAPSRGIPGNSIATNIGSMNNKGVEFSVGAKVLEKGKFSWNTSFNFTTIKNTVTALANNNADIYPSTGGLESSNVVRVGESIGSIFVIRTAGVNPENGRRIFVRTITLPDGTQRDQRIQFDFSAPAVSRWTDVETGAVVAGVTGADRVVIGSALPTWYGGFDNTFRLGNLDLNVLFQFSGGNYIYNGTKAGLRDMRPWNNHTDVLNRWQNPGDVTNIPRLVLGDNISNGSANPISENVEKGDFLRARNIALGYTLRNNFLNRANIASARVYAQVQNAFVLTGYSGADPEISTNRNSNQAPGVDRNSTPQARTFTLGLNLSF